MASDTTASAAIGPILYSNEQYEIRHTFNHDEYRKMWWAFMLELGWDRGYYDLDTYMNYSKGPGMILLLDKSTTPSTPVGHISAVINDNKTGWVAMFIIDAAHRGNQMGAALFKQCLADFEAQGTTVIGLDAVIMQQQTYERRKFVVSTLGEIEMWTRPLAAKLPVPKVLQPVGTHVPDIHKINGDLLAQHEAKVSGFYRSKLWSKELMFSRPDVGGCVLATRADPQSVDDILAWTLTRRCAGGVRVGPVYAQDLPSASFVIANATASATPKSIKAVPQPNLESNDWSEEQIAQKSTLITEVWTGNREATQAFAELGWTYTGMNFRRMWVDGKATPEQQDASGAAQRKVFAIFDAAVG